MNKDLIKLAGKVDITKTAMYVGGTLLLIILILYVRKKIKDVKAEKESEKIIEQYENMSAPEKRSYSDVEYKTMADNIYTHIHASVMSLNGGLTGVNQKGIYDVMSMMKTDDDLNMLISAYGTREYRKPGYFYIGGKPKAMLPATLSDVMTRGEIKEINERLEENGITFRLT